MIVRSGIIRSGLAALAILACCAAPDAPSRAASSAFSPHALAELAFAQHPGAALPADILLRDEQDRPVRLGGFFGHGRPLVLAFDYFRCTTLCGLVLGDLAATLQKVPLTPGRDYDVLAVSIDPRDTPLDAAALKSRHFDRDPALAGATHFLVGDATEVRRLADAVGFPFRFDTGIDQFAHPAGLVLVSPAGTVSRYILGIDYAPMDLRLGLVEASHGAIASPATHLLLLCYGYDPARGKYDLAVRDLLRATGAVSVLALGALVLVASRGARRS